MLQEVKDKAKITGPCQVAEIVCAILKAESEIDQDKEHWWAIGLNTRCGIKYIDLVSLGTLDANLTHPRETYRMAVHKGCHSLILAHNHPSGDVEPSDDDVFMTERLAKAGNILGIKLLDHVIVNIDQAYTSLKQIRPVIFEGRA